MSAVSILIALAIGQTPPPCLPRMVDEHLIYYPSGVGELDAERAARVKRVADYIDPGSGRVVVTGRADTIGLAPDNLELSRRRAAIVAAELARLGIPDGSIEIRALGETEPVVPTPDETDEPLNRLVVVGGTWTMRPSTRAALMARDCPAH